MIRTEYGLVEFRGDGQLLLAEVALITSKLYKVFANDKELVAELNGNLNRLDEAFIRACEAGINAAKEGEKDAESRRA